MTTIKELERRIELLEHICGVIANPNYGQNECLESNEAKEYSNLIEEKQRIIANLHTDIKKLCLENEELRAFIHQKLGL